VAKDGVRPNTSVSGAWGELICDAVGLGAGVADRLRQLGYQVSEFNGGFQPGRRDRFFNGRSESYWNLREILEAGRIALPKDEELFHELLSLNWRPTPLGLVQLESKSDLKLRLGKSPDRADCVSMLFYPRAVRRLRVGTFRI